MLCSPMAEGRGCTKVTKAILVSFRFSGVCACVSAVAPGVPKRTPESMELELQAAVDRLTWALETELHSSASAAPALKP